MNLLRPSIGGSRRGSQTASQIHPESTSHHRISSEAIRHKQTALEIHSSITNNPDDSSVLQSLLDKDPSAANIPDGESRTPLHTAARLGRTPHLDLLLARKDVDVDAVDIKKRTALHLASRHGHAACVERLLRAGANTEIADEKGHLARWYASSEDTRDLFDSPPRVVVKNLADGRGGSSRKKKKKETKTETETKSNANDRTTADYNYDYEEIVCSIPVPESRTAPSVSISKRVLEVDEEDQLEAEEEEEELDPATPAPPPRDLQRTLCEAFRGSFWEPNGENKWSLASVWDLVYDHGDKAVRRRGGGISTTTSTSSSASRKMRWFHLSATSQTWAKDLARNICAGSQDIRYTAERSREVCDFIARVFKSVDDEGPVRKHHFMVSFDVTYLRYPIPRTFSCSKLQKKKRKYLTYNRLGQH